MSDQVVREPVARAPELVIDVEDCATRVPKNRIDAFANQSVDKNPRATRSQIIIHRRCTDVRWTDWLCSKHSSYSLFGNRFSSSRKIAVSHQEPVNAFCGSPAVGYRPDNERLPASHVTSCKHSGNVRSLVIICRNVSSPIDRYTELSQQAFSLRPEKTERQQNQLSRPLLLGACKLVRYCAATVSSGPFNADGAQ